MSQSPPPAESVRPLPPLAIIGIGCRLPGGVTDPESYWRLLCEGKDAIVDVPPDRWDWRRYYDPDPSRPGKLYVRQGGFLQGGIDGLDASFFRMSPREAARLDPQQRLLLEVAWEAFEDAGLVPERLAGSDTGVFVGGFTSDQLVLQASPTNRGQIDTHTATGVGFTMLAARLSYTFDLRGPSQTLDTACSSSLVAMHHACNSLWSGECSLALVGGVNVIFNPEFVVVMCKGGFLSPDARCKAFDARANGYVRGEGAAVLVVKPLAQALADGDPVYATIRGTACNQDGFSNGITVPSQAAQEALLRRAYGRAGLPPSQVAYVEAHGTGTPVGDPIEARALGTVLGSGRPEGSPCVIGSVKTNIGHLEAASGVAALTKAALILKHRYIPRHLHFLTPNPSIPFAELGLEVAHTARELEPVGERAVVGVNSFGYGGTNAHVVLEEAPVAEPVRAGATAAGPRLFTLSARSEGALRSTAERWLSLRAVQPEADSEALADLAHTAATRRMHLEERASIVASTPLELSEALRSLAAAEPHPALSRGRLSAQRKPRLAFVYTGMGPQWWGMGRELFAQEPVFRAEVEACDALMRRIGGLSVIEELHRPEAESRMASTLVAQTTNFALQAGLTALWRQWGVVPEAVVGHSVGEVGSAYASGMLSLEDAVTVSFHRARLQAETAGRGGMLAVGLSEAEAEQLLEGRREKISIAAINSVDSLTLAGELEALEQVALELQSRQVFHRRLRVEVAYHSPQMDPLEERLRQALAGLRPSEPRLPLYSTVTGRRVEGASWDGGYWWSNVRQPVRFAAAAESLILEGYDTFIEVGPHPVLAASLRSGLGRHQRTAQVLHSLYRERPEQASMLAALGALHAMGVEVALGTLHTQARRVVPLPRYPWQRERCWSESMASLQERTGGEPVLPGRVLHGPAPAWERELNAQYLPWLEDHRVQGAVVFPAAGHLAAVLAAARSALGTQAVAVEQVVLHRALLVGREEPLLRTSLQPQAQRFQVHGSQRTEPPSAWVLHVEGSYGPASLFAAPAPLELAALRARCLRQVPREELYRQLAARGLEYGPTFQTVEALYAGEQEMLVELASRVEVEGEPLSPPQLDGCFQALLGAWPGLEGAFVPVRLERLVLHAPSQPRVWAWGRMLRLEADWCEADIALYDETGAPVAEVRGLRCQRLPAALTQAESVAEHLYQEQWHPQPPASPPPPSAAGAWLLVGPRGELAAALARALEERGGRVVQVTTRAELRPALQALRGAEPPCRAVLDLAALEEASTAEVSAAALRQATRVLELAQVLGRTRWRSAPRLWLVTRGAHAVGSPGEPPPMPTLAPLWGLARVLTNESPELRPSLVDLEPAGPVQADVAALLQECLVDGAESEVAWRGTQRFTRRLVRVEPSELGRHQAQLSREVLALEPAAGAEPVAFRESARRPPGPGEVELRVQAASLGVQELRALRRAGRAPQALGLECVGTVVACGPGVSHLAVGDRVMAVAPGCLRTHVVAPAALLVRCSPDLPLVHAAAPLSLAAACHALEALERLGAEPWVLVHGADSTGGQASVHRARARGARVLFTADDEASIQSLQLTGALHVGPVGTYAFVDPVRERTRGRGVDLALQWASHATGARLGALLAEGGWLVQLVPTEGAQEELPAVSAVVERLDLAALVHSRPERLAAWLAALPAALKSGELGPGEGVVLAPEQAAGVLGLLQQGASPTPRVLSFEQGSVTVGPAREGPWLSAEATYLVLGGMRGFGLATAHWLVERGARHLVLASRSGQVQPAEASRLEAMRATGATVHTVAVDISQEAQVEQLVSRLQQQGPPLRGVVHAATVYDDEFIQRLDEERLVGVLAPKVHGAWALHKATAGLELDFFLLYASGASVLGLQGQAAYGAANLFLDALAEHRRALGLPATSLAWGALDSGLVARDEGVARRLEQQGAIALALPEALDMLAALMRARVARCMPMLIRWAQWARVYPHASAQPRFASLVAPKDSGDGAASLREAVRRASPPQRLELLVQALRERVAHVFGISPSRLDPACSLRDMALDSLTATELKNRIDRDLGTSVPVLRLLEGRSVLELAELIAGMLDASSAPPADKSAAA